jgi:hypothetical protein
MATQSKATESEVTHSSEETHAITMDSAVGAAFIASGIGTLVLGLTVIGAEANESIKTALTFNSAVGALSGKTIVTVIAFVASWIILHIIFRERPIKLATSFVITLVLVALGLLLTFPPVFLVFGG